MQQEWKFKIEAHMIIPGMENQTLNIYPENIKTITRISDYIYKNEPMILLHLSIDKNFFDLIIQNAKTETMYLKIEKYNVGDDMDTPATTVYIEDEFNVMVSNDINYNKETDYMDKDENGQDKKDVYKTLVIGLMSKKCIDANKKVANTVIYNSSMMDIACSYMSDLHFLIEPFDHNSTKEQLTIPPQDTLSKIIDYLNSVEVFYNTKYLFFIDEPYCTYLISRSGKGIQKSDEPYKDVLFNIRSITDPNMAVQGMTEDEEKKQYVIDVPSVNTKYMIDHDAAKVYDKINAVVNPSTDNDVDSNKNIEESRNEINKYIGKFREQVHKFSKENAGMVNKIESNSHSFTAQLEDVMKPSFNSLSNIANTAIAGQLSSIPTSVDVTVGKASVSVPMIAGGFAGGIMSGVAGNLTNITSSISGIDKINNAYSQLSYDMVPTCYSMTKLDNYLGAVTEVNAQDIISSTTKMTSALNSTVSSLKSLNVSNITGQMSHISNVVSKVGSTVDKLNSVVKTIDKIQSSSMYSKVVEQHSGISDTFDMIKQNVDKMKVMSDKITDSCNKMNNLIQEANQAVNKVNSFANTISNVSKSFSNIGKVNFKGNFCSLTSTINNVNRTVSSATKAFSEIGKVLSSGTMTFDSIRLIGKNLNKVKSISGIGKYGLSNFETDLKIGGCFGQGKDGTMLIKIQNDNPNQIKNIKSEMETMINQFSVTKQGLDPSVFTPNKRYIVSNYDAHSDKDGIFVLNKKTEYYVREDESFTCNIILNMAKVLEESDTDKVTDTSVSDNNTKATDWKKQSGGEVVDGNSTVNADKSGNGILVKKTTTTSESGTRSDMRSIMNFPNVIMH